MHRPQTETSRTNNVDKDKLSDTDECEPSAEPKAKAARRNFQSTWLEKFSGCDTTTQRVCCFRFPSSLGKQIPSLLAASISELRH